MSGICPAARELAERMAAACLGAGAGGEVPERLVQMLLPAAEVATEAYALARETEARADVLAGVVSGLVLRDAEARGEFDVALTSDGGYTGVRARKEVPGVG